MLNLNQHRLKSKIKTVKILCGSLYRHPHYNFDDFFKYLESCLIILAKENKEVYMW